MTKPVMAGIDLHSNNLMIGIVDQGGKRLKHQKVGCDLKEVLAVLAPYKRRLFPKTVAEPPASQVKGLAKSPVD